MCTYIIQRFCIWLCFFVIDWYCGLMNASNLLKSTANGCASLLPALSKMLAYRTCVLSMLLGVPDLKGASLNIVCRPLLVLFIQKESVRLEKKLLRFRRFVFRLVFGLDPKLILLCLRNLSSTPLYYFVCYVSSSVSAYSSLMIFCF